MDLFKNKLGASIERKLFRAIAGAEAALIAVAIGLAGHAVSTPASGHASTQPPVVIAFSATAEGNGYNWPSSLGWLSEQLLIAREEALQYRANGREALIDITSVGGGSSGSAVTMLLDAALNNPTIVAQPSDRRLLTTDEVERLAETVRFVSLSLDLTKAEEAATALQAAKKQFEARIQWLVSHIPFLRAWFKIEKPVWFPSIDSRNVVSQFGKSIHFVREVDFQAVINQPIDRVPGYEALRSRAKLDRAHGNEADAVFGSIQKIFDLPKVQLQNVKSPTPMQQKWLTELTQLRRAALRQIVTAELQKSTRLVQDAWKRFGGNMTPKIGSESVQDNPFARTLAGPVQSGLVTFSLMAHFNSTAELHHVLREEGKIDYRQLRLYAFMDEATARAILQSNLYREATHDPQNKLNRFVIAVVDQRFAAMNLSIREPGLMEELYGDADSDQFRIRALYDPQTDLKREFHLKNTAAPEFRGKPLFAVGGFAAELITAQLQSVVHDERVRELRREGFEVVPRYHTFAKQHEWYQNVTFATHQLAGILNDDGKEGAIDNVRDYFDWMSEFYQRWLSRLTVDRASVVQTWLDWDVRVLPGALAGVSDLLVVKAVNAARSAWYESQYGASFHPAALGALDREPKSGLPEAERDKNRSETLCRDLF